MNTLYRRNDINEEGYILCVDDNNEIPICIQKNNVYPFEIYSFEDVLDEYPESVTKLGELNENLADTIINYAAYAHKIDEIERKIDALNSDCAISRYDDWYNNGGYLPDEYIPPEYKQIQELENEYSHLITRYETASGKEFTKPSDIFKEVSEAAQTMQADLKEENELSRS